MFQDPGDNISKFKVIRPIYVHDCPYSVRSIKLSYCVTATIVGGTGPKIGQG